MGPSVIWQLTQKCELQCRSCSIDAAESRRGVDELSTFEAYAVIDQIAALRPKRFLISGGDPLERQDVFQLVDYARRRRLDPAVVVSPTRNLTRENLGALRRAGLTRIVFSLNGSTAERHEAVQGLPGSFALTLQAMQWARESGTALEIDTLVTPNTLPDLDGIAALIEPFEIEGWNVHFPVPAGRSAPETLIPQEAERVLDVLADMADTAPFVIRTVEAPQFRRVYQQRNTAWSDLAGYVLDGERLDEVVFITSHGEVRPGEFFPLSGDLLRHRTLSEIYRTSDVFNALAEPSNLDGKCGRCQYRRACGGSRARAWAMHGNLFASDPLCPWQPAMEGSV